MRKITQSELNKLIYEAISEVADSSNMLSTSLEEANTNDEVPPTEEYKNNTDLFIKTLEDINTDLEEVMSEINVENDENRNKMSDQWKGKWMKESLIDRSVRRAIRTFLNEGETTSPLDNALAILTNAKSSGGNLDDTQKELLRQNFSKLLGNNGDNNVSNNGVENYYSNMQKKEKIKSLLNNISQKYLSIYNELTRTAWTNFRGMYLKENIFKNWYNKYSNNFRKKNSHLLIKDYTKFLNRLKKLYDEKFRQFYKLVLSGSYSNAIMLGNTIQRENINLANMIRQETNQQTGQVTNINNGQPGTQS